MCTHPTMRRMNSDMATTLGILTAVLSLTNSRSFLLLIIPRGTRSLKFLLPVFLKRASISRSLLLVPQGARRKRIRHAPQWLPGGAFRSCGMQSLLVGLLQFLHESYVGLLCLVLAQTFQGCPRVMFGLTHEIRHARARPGAIPLLALLVQRIQPQFRGTVGFLREPGRLRSRFFEFSVKKVCHRTSPHG